MYIFVTAAAVVAMLGACEDEVRKKKDSPSYCEAYCECQECDDLAMDQCEADQNTAEQQAEDAGCLDEYESLAECAAEDGECVGGQYEVTDACAEQANAYLVCASGGEICPTTGDGVCNEPEGTNTCAEGSDIADCNTCATTNNGTCDEPEGTGTCPEGTDVFDCTGSGCPWTNNGTCDEPEGTGACPEGTDVNDCDAPPCATTNNGVCDEPEGTAICPEGTDVNDCVVESCDSMGSCDLCQECAFAGPCATQLNTCQNNPDCTAFAGCINDCQTSCQNNSDPDNCMNICVNGTGGCTATHPDGVNDYSALVDCVITQECSVSCS
jgi:hypothetical protein